MKFIIIILLFFFLFFINCKTSAQDLFSSDTLKINESYLVYWQMNMNEYDSVFAQNTIKIDSLFYEFNLNIEKLAPFLKKKGLKSVKTDSPFLLFSLPCNKSATIERKKLTYEFGVILYSTNKEPLILPGVNSTLYIMKKLKEYFN